MTSHTSITSPLVPRGGAVAASGCSTRMVETLVNIEQGRCKTALDEWENEGGRVAVDTAPEPFPIERQIGVQDEQLPQNPHGADASWNALYPADRVSPGVDIKSYREHACPQCHSPLDRVRRRIVDRVRSLISPVHRYRCRMKGWNCDWEGNLRTK